MSNYQKRKNRAREKAIFWQQFFADVSLSYSDLVFWQDYFTRIAKRCGLVKEFRENAII